MTISNLEVKVADAATVATTDFTISTINSSTATEIIEEATTGFSSKSASKLIPYIPTVPRKAVINASTATTNSVIRTTFQLPTGVTMTETGVISFQIGSLITTADNMYMYLRDLYGTKSSYLYPLHYASNVIYGLV